MSETTRTALAVTYDDGTTATIQIRPVAAVAAERHFGADVPPMEGTLYAAWISAQKPFGNFDAWLSKVEAVAEVELDVLAAPADEAEPGEAAAGA